MKNTPPDTGNPQDQAIALFVNTIETLGQFWSQSVFDFVRNETVREGRRLRLFLACVRLLRRSRLSAYLLVCIAVLIFPWRCFARRPVDFYLVSLSLNNSRALARFKRIIDRRFDLPVDINHVSIPLWTRLRIIRRHPDRDRILQALIGRGHAENTVFMNQIIGVACAMLFAEDLKQSQPRIIGVANDHSPVTVALLETGKALGIPRLYVQHAPVTGYFPPLSVDMAVLEDYYSAEHYFEAARKAGVEPPEEDNIFLLPSRRNGEMADLADLTARPLRLCIVLSLYPDMAAVERLCAELAGLDNIAAISLKPHPRFRKHLGALVQRGLTLLPDDMPPEEVIAAADVFVVSNSGMSWQLVQSGKPVLFDDQLDYLHQDYFGLQAAGLTPGYALDFLKHPKTLQDFFGPEWRARLQAINPAPALSDTELEDRIAARLAEFLPPQQ